MLSILSIKNHMKGGDKMKTLCYLLDEVKDSWDVELEPDEKEKVHTALTVVDGYYWKD